MGVRERKDRKKEQLRQAILNAAEELFIREGYESVTMRRIAEKIEYSPTTIYLYFKDKDELLYVLGEKYCVELLDLQRRSTMGDDDPIHRLLRGQRTLIAFGLKHPERYRLLFMTLFRSEAYFRENSKGIQAYDILREIVKDCIGRGLFRRIDPEAVSQALWSAAHGLTSLLITHPHFPWVDREQLIETVLEMTMEGLKA